MHIGHTPATCRAGELALQNPLWTLLSRRLDHENPLDFRLEHREDQTRSGRLGVGALRAGRRRKSTTAYEPTRQLAELDLAHALIDSDRLQSTSAAHPVRGPARGNRPIRTNERDRHDPPGTSARPRQILAFWPNPGNSKYRPSPFGITAIGFRSLFRTVLSGLLGRSGSAISLVRRRNNPNRRTFPDLLRRRLAVRGGPSAASALTHRIRGAKRHVRTAGTTGCGRQFGCWEQP